MDLTSGQNTRLIADGIPADDIVVGFGWRVIVSNGPQPELVPAAILLGENGRAVDADAMVFFNQLSAAVGAVKYVTGDDKEQIDIDLSAVPPQIAKIVLVVFVNPDERKPGTFAPVRDAYVHVTTGSGAPIVRFRVPQQDDTVSAVNFGELYRHQGAWKFRALGDGYRNGVADVTRAFGIPA